MRLLSPLVGRASGGFPLFQCFNLWRQCAAHAVAGGKSAVKLRAMPGDQRRQPMAGERPKPVPPGAASAPDQLAEAAIVRVNDIRPLGEYANPAAWQFSVQPNAGFLPDGHRDGARNDGRVGFKAAALFPRAGW